MPDEDSNKTGIVLIKMAPAYLPAVSSNQEKP